MFQTLPVNIVEGHYLSRSRPLSSQTTINLIPEVNPSGRTVTALQNFYGSKLVSPNTERDRGSHVFKKNLYVVQGTTLSRVNEVGTRTAIGTVAGTSYCIFADDGFTMSITTGAQAYTYDGTTLAQITDPDIESPNGVALINNQMIYDGNNGRWVVATPADPGDIPDINYAVAESNGDDLLRVYEFNQTLYLFGEKSIETWFNSGRGSPPFTRIEGGVIKKGLFAPNSVANTSQFIYFLDSQKNISRVTGYQDEPITPPAIANQLFKLDSADAIGVTMNIDGQDLYVITFPSADKTFAYSETFGTWSQLSFGVNGGRHLMNSYQFVYGKHFITDYRNGNVYELDAETYSDNGEVQIRQRDSAPINGVSLGLPGKRFVMSRFEFLVETGVGLASGQGSAPDFMIYTSIDGGRTFDNQGSGYISPGESGDYIIKVELFKMLVFAELIIRIRVSDPVFVSIHGAAIDVDLAGY